MNNDYTDLPGDAQWMDLDELRIFITEWVIDVIAPK